MDTKFPKAGSVRPFEQGIRRLHIPDLLQTCQAHFLCKVLMDLCKRGNIIFFRDSWQFSFKIKVLKPQIHLRNALRISGLCFTCAFCGSVACFKDSTRHSFKHFFQVTAMPSLGQLDVLYKPTMQVRSAIFVYYCKKCKQSAPALIECLGVSNVFPNAA